MLTREGCLARQDTLRNILHARKLRGAILTDPHEIYYFTGWLRSSEHPEALILHDRTILISAETPPSKQVLIDDHIPYEASVFATTQPDRLQRLITAGASVLQDLHGRRVGYRAEDLPHAFVQSVRAEWESIDPSIVAMQTVKHPDEIACIRRAIDVTEAGYEALKDAVRPGLNELEAFNLAYSAVVRAAGAIVPYAGDFQSSSPGGRARNRTIEAGELYILDTFPIVDGYWADMSRTFAVGGSPTALQHEAWQLVVEALRVGEEAVHPGAPAADVHRKMEKVLSAFARDGARILPHHGGHGMGLRAHEIPRIDPIFDDVFETGMVFTLEPGVYHPELRAGIRLEHNYVLTENGVERISSFPLELV